jgi:hypothetical protein
MKIGFGVSLTVAGLAASLMAADPVAQEAVAVPVAEPVAVPVTLPPANITPPLIPAPEVEVPAEIGESDAEFLEFPVELVQPVETGVVAEEFRTDNVIAGGGDRVGWRKNLFPHFRIGGFYDDNIFIQEHDKQSDFIGFAGFGLRFGLGDVRAPLYTLREARNVPILYEAPPQPFGNFILADYSGSYMVFADHSSQNSYDQDALVSMGWMGSKLALGFEGKFQSLSSPDIDAGGRVRRYILHAGVNINYEVSDKTSIEANFAYTGTEYSGLTDFAEFLNEDWLNIQITPKLKIAPGIGVGVLTIQDSSDQPFGRVLIRAVYECSEKLAFSGRIGVEYRDVERGSAFRNNPIFALGATYAPWDGTSLSVGGYRLAEASALLAGADYTRTGVDLKLQQRFLQRFFAKLTGGYENLDYHAVSGDSSINRNDDYFFGRAAVAFDFTRWGNAEIFYNYQKDSSNRPGSSFTDNQVGIEFDFAF